MKRKIMTGFLALVLVLQAFIPSFAYALEEKPKDNKLITKKLESPDSNFITIGKLKGVGFSKDNPTASISVEEVEQKNNHKKEALGGLEIGDEIVPQALRSTKSPYIQGQQPADSEKPKYWANVQGKLTTVGIDGTTFDWNKVLGQGAKVKLLFTQTSGNVMTGVRFYLEVDKDGTYTWQGSDGKPTYLPLYDVDGNPYTYNVQIQRNFSENAQLIIQESNGTPKAKFRQEGDKQVATISFLDIEIQQVASTKFVSEWHTSLEESNRPQIEGYFKVDDETDNTFNFPKNNTARTILRASFLENFVEDEDNGPWAFISSELETKPETVEVKTDTQGLTFEEADGVKTVKSDDHKFKYDFTYDVINGGKLTMTEVIPVTFDANGGKFEKFTAPDTETKIVKEVDYEGTLTDKAEEPKREEKTFKGWSLTKGGDIVTDADFANIKEAKTFYAIWENNDIKAKELTVAESFNNGTEYVNDFIPTLDILKGQIKIKDANGVYQELKDGDSLQILDDSGNPIADDDLKDNLYDKLKEDSSTEISRNLTLKAKVNFADGTSQGIEIPIKVIKNIYEGTSTGGKPSYVPENYVKVTVDPTDKATNSQKTYYYVNPAAKVVIPGSNPTGTGDNVFTKWLIKGTTEEYKLADKPRHMFTAETTIEAQYDKEGKGIIKIAYVDENGNEISADYHKDGVDYPSKKEGKLNSEARDEEFPKPGPDFKGYIYSSRDDIKGKYYKDQSDPDNLDTVKYSFFKKVTTDTPSNTFAYFPVIFDANTGEFEAAPKDKKTVYVYFNGNDATVEKVTFKEVRDEFEKAYSNPTKDGFDFKEWQDKADKGSEVADNYEIQFKGWDSQTYEPTGDTFYAHYGKASALISYLDLNGKAIADKFKIDGVEYPTEKEGTLDQAIDKNVYTADTAPKFIGYKFNRIELNPANAKYAMDNKATIKIYYEKLPDIIPEKDGSGKPNEKPEGYVEVKFVPTDKAKDTTEKMFYVNPKKDVTISIANPEAIATYTFKEWKMGANADGATYTPSTAQKFTNDLTVITATYEETENIIPYDPSDPDPMPRPDGYVRVTFAADPGLKLTENKAYYVKANAGITLGNADLAKPGYEAQTGYKFDKWDKKDDLEIVTTDITVTAKATKLDNVIPEKDGEGNPNTKPEGYKEVTFVIKDDDKTKGSIDGVAKFYVNPTEYVTINPPAPKANTGYEFGAWDKDATIPTVYDKDTTITGSFNGLKDIIPNKNPDGTENKKPAGYKTVTFVIDPATGGKISDKEVTVYYVNPAKEVTVPQPKTAADTGYVFEKWDQDTATAKKYEQDTTVKGNFKKLDDIIPSTDENGKPNAKPEGYVTVTFDKGNHGSLTGQTVYYVNPEANPVKTLGDPSIVKPEVKSETGYKFKSWNFADTKQILSDITVTAQYDSIDDIVPKTKEDGTENKQPNGYITVTFEKGEHGELEGNTTFYINPNKAVVFEEKAPTIKPNTGYTSAGWDTTINKAIQYKDGDKITALYNELGDVIPQGDPNGSDKPAGYLTVTFDKGDHGTLSGKTVYYVKPNKEVTVPAPTVTPETGWKQKDGTDAWDKLLTQTFTEDTKITAQYASLENIIPGDQTKPDGYFTVTFKAENGSLAGTTSYYVKPNVEVDLTDTANAIGKKADVGYTEDGGTWDKALKATFTKDETYTFNFVKLDDVIPKDNPQGGENTKPDGYVIVEFIADANGSIVGGNKTYYVNPEKNITVGSTNLPIPETKPGTNYVFDGWYEAIDKTEPIKNDKKFVARFKLNKVKMTYKADDATTGTVPAALSYEIGTEITIAGGNDLKKDNAVLTGWKIGDKTYTPGQKFIINDNTTATAVWEAGLHTVEFDTDGAGHIPSQQVKHGEKIKEVTNPQKDGYFFTGWTLNGNPFNPKTDVVTEDITLVANYSKDIIPQTGDNKPEGVPDSFVLVEFKEGTNGTLTGTTKYWVNPTAGKKLSDIVHPSVTANEGWKHTGWDKTEDIEINAELKVTAKYLKKVLTEQPTENAEKYVKVEFKQGEHGTIDANATSTYWVLKDEAVTLTPPAVNPNTGYAQKTGDGAWSPKVETSYSIDTEHVAQYDYNGKDVIPQPGSDKPDNVPENFVLVEFKPGDHGSIASTETVKYWVNPTKLVTLTPPTVTPNAGYEQEKGLGAWDKYLRDMFTEDKVITAQYRKLEEPCPPPTPDPDNPNPDKPNPWDPNPWNPDYPKPWNPNYPDLPYIPRYPEIRYETIVQEKIVKVPVPIADNAYIKEVRYMQGFMGDFRPKDGLTRAEAAQILANALVEDGYKYNANFKLPYKDIGEAWYTRAVKIVTEAKVFAGYDDGNFKPQDKITRNEWIATLKRFQELGDVSGNHMKLKDGHWAMAEIEAAYKEGWLKIYTDGLATYEGDKFIPREEVAAVSNKAFNRVLDKTYIINNDKNLITYKDVKKDMWSYEDILCASNTFLYKKDLYRAHWIKEDNNQFNINTDGFEIVKAKFQRNPR